MTNAWLRTRYDVPETGRQLILAAVLLASGNLLGKLAGLANQVVASSYFGAGAAMDAYFAVLAVPVFVTGIISSTLTNTITPVYLQQKQSFGAESADALFRATLSWAILVTGTMSAVILVFGSLVIRLVAPGLNGSQLQEAYRLYPFVFPVLGMNTVVALITAAINAEGQYAKPAYTTVLPPIAMASTTLLWGRAWGVAALAMGLLVGTTIQLAVNLILAERRGIRCRPTLHLNPPGIQRVARSILVLSSGVLIVQIGPVVDQVVSSWLPVGSLSAINYSLKIIGIPSSLLFVSVSRVLLPRFSTLVAVGDTVALKRSFRASVWIVGGLTLVISIVFIVFSEPIVRLLYRRGSFDEAAVQATAGALIGFSIGLVPMGIGFLAPRVFNALNRNSILAKLALVTFVTNFVLDVVLSHYLLQIGIALSSSITYAVTSSIMLIVLGRSIGGLGLLPSLTTPRRAVSRD